ncbi:uncharacterized protein LOC117343823 [Pecten maximus]|uniref:uncharacterized protein LOC117343823 n=1 Tax=Pecten maximus TaxID=6579 RepID=UPI001458FFE1|nr:uncharacterized protein LOC117343823 [Pecten maximus]
MKTADMTSLTPEIPSTTTGDIRTADHSPGKNLSLNEKCQSRVTRSRQKSSNINQGSISVEKKRSKQDGPDTDDLLQYLANESCGALETDQLKGNRKPQGSLLKDIEILDQSSDDENDVAMMYSNVNEEEEEDEEEIFNEEVAVGKDLISLGKEAKLLKDKLLEAKTVTFDEINEKDDIYKSEEERNDAEQQKTNLDLDSKVDHLTIYSGIDTTTSGVERLEFRPKKKLLFRGKQTPDNDEEDVTQLSDTSLGHSFQDFFNKPVHNVTHTYGSRKNTKLEKTRMVQKWLKSTSDDVSNNTSLSDVETQMEKKTQTASKNKENLTAGAKVASSCVDNRLPQDMSINQDEMRPIVNTKRKIFKTRQDHQSNMTMTVQQVKGKFVVRKISPVRPEQELEKKITSEKKSGEMLGDSQGSDPYEFKTSQRTPKAKNGKKKSLTKKDVKKCRKNPIDIKIGHSTAVNKEKVIDLTSKTRSQGDKLGSRSSLRSGSKENIEGSNRRETHKVKSDGVLQQRTEDVEQIIEDLNQAEEYDLVFGTQEAKDQITEFEGESPHVVVENAGGKDKNNLDEEKENCSQPAISSPDKTDIAQKGMDIEVVKEDKKSSARNRQKITASSQKEVEVRSKRCPDTEIKDAVQENCRGKCQDAEQDEKLSIEDTESAVVLSDASCIPNTEDSILSKHTRKLRNNLKSRKSVTFTDKVQHILVQGHNNSEGQTGHGSRGQRSSGSESRDHSQDQSERVTRGQRSSGSESRYHSQDQSERVTRGQRSSGSESRDHSQDQSERGTRGQSSLKCESRDHSQDQSERVTRGQRSSGSESRDHSQDQSERVTRGQRSSGSESRDHSQDQSERVTRRQRSSGSESRDHSQDQSERVTRGQRSSGSESRGQIFKENLTQDLQQKRLSTTGASNQQETTDDVQPIDHCIDEHGQDQSSGQCPPEDMDEKNSDSCMTNTVPDTLEENSLLYERRKSCRVEQAQLHSSIRQKNTEGKTLVDQSQTMDPEQEIFTESHISDEIPEADVEIIHPCENTSDTVSTQPPSDNIQFGVGSDLNIMMTENSSASKTNNSKKTLSSPKTLQDKSQLVIMETQMSGNISSDCVTLETQESVSLFVANDWKETEQAGVVDDPQGRTTKKLSEREGDSVEPVSRKNKLKRSSTRMMSQSVASLSMTSPSLVDSGVRSSRKDKLNSRAIGAESNVICGQDSVTISGSTIIPVTAEASRDTTQVIQICEVDEEPTRRYNKQNDVENMSADVSSSVKIDNTSLSEVFTEEDSQSIKCRRNSRRKSSCKDKLRNKGTQSKKDLPNRNVQENDNDQDQQKERSGIQRKSEKWDNPCKDGTRQGIIHEENEGSIGELVCEKLESVQSIDEDDLTPTLKPVDKRHNHRHVIRQGCSPEDIFIMDSETLAGGESLSIAQNQEGIIGMADFQSLTNSQSQITEIKDNSQTQITEGKDNSRTQITEGKDNSQTQITEGKDNSQTQITEGKDNSQTQITEGKDNSQTQITEGKDNSQTQTIKKKVSSNSQLQIMEEIDIELNVDSDDSEHSDMETNQLKSTELPEKKMEANKKVPTLNTCAEKANRNKLGNNEEGDNMDTDSDLSQSRQRKKTGVRCVRGLATRRRQLESQDRSCHTNTTNSKGRDSVKSPGQPTSNQINTERDFTDNDCHEYEDNSTETKLLLNNRNESENQKSRKLKEKFKKTFKKHLSRSPNIGSMQDSSSPGHSSLSNHSVLQIDKQLPVWDDDDETEKPDIVENSQHKNESDIVIPDSFPCSSKTMKDMSSGQSSKSPTAIQTKSSQRNDNRKNRGDSLKLLPLNHREVDKLDSADKTESEADESFGCDVQRRPVAGRRRRRPVIEESEAEESLCCDVQRRPVAGRRRRRPVIEESEDEMCDASSPLPDITINGRHETSKDKKSDLSAIVDSEGEERTEETDNECDDKDIKGNDEPVVIAESEEDGNDNYSSSVESDSSRRLNLTSSSAFSSQSEAMTTQNRKALEKDLERMKREIAELEKQLGNNPNRVNKSVLSSKTKAEEQAVSEDSDSDFVLEKEADEQNDQIEDDQQNDVIDLATSSSSFKASQGSRSREIEKHNADSDESDELFLSPLPPSPPPTPAQSAKKTPVQLPDHILQTTEFLNRFRRTGSQGLLNSQDSVGTDSGSKRYKSKLSLNMTTEAEKQTNKLSSPCGNTYQLKENVSSPMFESSQLTARRYPGTSEVDDAIDHSNRQSQCRGFITTGLTYLQTREIQKLAQQNNIKFFVKFNSFVTHVIVKTVPPGQRVCERTLKFFQGVANQCWVLDYQWVTDSKAAGQLLPEDKYEIIGDTITGNGHYGPRQSRLSNRLLLEGFHFFCLGTSESLTTDDLVDLIERCGGTVVDHPSDLPNEINLT